MKIVCPPIAVAVLFLGCTQLPLAERADMADATATDLPTTTKEIHDPVDLERRRRAAEGGDVAEQVALGSMYANGHGVPKDDVQAYAWFNLAAAQGSGIARGNRDRIASDMTREQVAEAQRLSRELLDKRQESEKKRSQAVPNRDDRGSPEATMARPAPQERTVYDDLILEVLGWQEELRYRSKGRSVQFAARTMRRMVGTDVHRLAQRVGSDESMELLSRAVDVAASDDEASMRSFGATNENFDALSIVMEITMGAKLMMETYDMSEDAIQSLVQLQEGDLDAHEDLAQRIDVRELAHSAATAYCEQFNAGDAQAIAAFSNDGATLQQYKQMLALTERTQVSALGEGVEGPDWRAFTARWQWWFRGRTEPRQSTLLMIYQRTRSGRWAPTYRGFADQGESEYQQLRSRFPGIERLSWYD